MVRSPIELALLDVDGTLVDLHRATAISEPVHAAIRDVQAAGVRVSIATGRTLDYVRQNLASLGIVTPVITTQGAVIGDPQTGHVLHETTIPLDQARQLAEWADNTHRVSAFYFTDDEGHTHIRQNFVAGDEEFFNHVMGAPREMVGPLSALLAGAAPHPPVKLLMFSDVSQEADLAEQLQAHFHSKLNVMRTHPYLVEVTAQGVDKGSGVLHLCEHLGIEPARVLAIGDHDNDIPMMRVVGTRVAMGNGSEGVKAHADWIAPSIEEEGAAVALRRFVLGQGV